MEYICKGMLELPPSWCLDALAADMDRKCPAVMEEMEIGHLPGEIGALCRPAFDVLRSGSLFPLDVDLERVQLVVQR